MWVEKQADNALGITQCLAWAGCNEFRANDGISLELQIFITTLQYNLKWLRRLFFKTGCEPICNERQPDSRLYMHYLGNGSQHSAGRLLMYFIQKNYTPALTRSISDLLFTKKTKHRKSLTASLTYLCGPIHLIYLSQQGCAALKSLNGVFVTWWI